MIQPKAGVDYDPGAPMCQDDYEYLTSSGRYIGSGWAEWRERSERIRFWLRVDRQAVQKWRRAQARYRAAIGTPAEWQAWQDLIVARRLRAWAGERTIRSFRG